MLVCLVSRDGWGAVGRGVGKTFEGFCFVCLAFGDEELMGGEGGSRKLRKVKELFGENLLAGFVMDNRGG
jgi:hypothetical protein